jgi:protein-tyrosine phosphatase
MTGSRSDPIAPEPWTAEAAGVLTLPSGRRVRGRAFRRTLPDGPAPTFAVYLSDKAPPAVPWESRWVHWPDFRLPRDRDAARRALLEAWRRLGSDRVEIACGGGVGRTGTALACLVALDAGSSVDAVRYVRDHYDRRAVETPGQRRYVAVFASVPYQE